MPRFFFDVDQGGRHCRDRDGIDLMSVDQVPAEVSGLLLDLAHSDVSAVGRIISVDVRDTSGRLVYRATMTIAVRRP